MIFHLKKRKLMLFICIPVLILLCLGLCFFAFGEKEAESEKKYIKWVELNVTAKALKDATQADIDSFDKLYHISFIDILSYLAVKNSNNFSSYKTSQLDSLINELGSSKTIDDLMGDNKYYAYYKEAFSAALGGLLGEYEREVPDGNGGKTVKTGYGVVAYSPIAEGFSYSHYDDFGNSRTYGYRRTHLGNDLLGNVGTPIVAVEGGTVECFGWNQYGGWRLGIRSLDGKRSYYYAHLRQNRPYAEGLKEGSVVNAGEVIGYMGMTGYSTKENVNGMTVPHLHFGLQLVFDESQKEGINQIWLNCYELVKFLSQNRATTIRDEATKEYTRKYNIKIKSYQNGFTY